jgi:serine phosphatase RsbU (regulator of sigma subunit)
MCAIIDPTTGHTILANAGHNVPYICNGLRLREFRATGMPLGLMAGISYEESKTVLGPGDSFVLHSDGIAEARNDAGEMFGFPRMKAVLEMNHDAESAITALLDELSAFAGPQWEQEDDITLVVFERLSETRSINLIDPAVSSAPRSSESTSHRI